ncbi:hypothetical protein SAMN05192545_3937 [Maribacter dokdonensis]|uniref:Uncharacterized protein n=1 Tax=Maribacter dokdonensis TaxID=320912 RepID=A0ABY0V0P8_9FLAO|nr:hypothetical protein [Maribacter dokdonensis]SDT47513.1 hypothetical protein SAMN05192545_3937 [Maribacter dokdonensis]
MAKINIWIEKMIELLEDTHTALLSDIDVFVLVNSHLEKDERISMARFKQLKSPNQQRANSISQTKLSDEEKERFLDAINLSRVKQKIALTGKAFDNPKGAYPFLWALERKNADLQLNKGNSEGSGNVTINITAGNSEHKELIEDILSGTIDVPHEEVNENKLLE